MELLVSRSGYEFIEYSHEIFADIITEVACGVLGYEGLQEWFRKRIARPQSMKAYKATLSKGDSVFAESLAVYLQERNPRPSRLPSWEGWFRLCAETHPDAHTLLSHKPSDDPYTLTLDDGRSGKVWVRGVNREPTSWEIEFTGTGPLLD